jgi:hypothetical protein
MREHNLALLHAAFLLDPLLCDRAHSKIPISGATKRKPATVAQERAAISAGAACLRETAEAEAANHTSRADARGDAKRAANGTHLRAMVAIDQWVAAVVVQTGVHTWGGSRAVARSGRLVPATVLRQHRALHAGARAWKLALFNTALLLHHGL